MMEQVLGAKGLIRDFKAFLYASENMELYDIETGTQSHTSMEFISSRHSKLRKILLKKWWQKFMLKQ
jgi:hypothetical protein